MNSDAYMKNKLEKLEEDRQNACHGEFFFAKFSVNNTTVRESPVFVIGNDGDKEDVIICNCTKQPARTDFDVPVKLKLPTHVRTNKIYTILRNQLLFKIPQTATSEEYRKIIDKLKSSINLNT